MEKTCPITRILGYLGKKWMLIILRELQSGEMRFNGFMKIDGINSRILSRRLKELEKLGLVSRKRFAEIPPRVEYSLTEKGKSLVRCFKYVDDWARKFD